MIFTSTSSVIAVCSGCHHYGTFQRVRGSNFYFKTTRFKCSNHQRHRKMALKPLLCRSLSTISTSRTGTTAALWKMRAELESYKKATKPQTVLLDKSPSDSFWSIDLPLLSNSELRDQYSNFLGGVRFGRILEDIDSFAANIGNRRREIFCCYLQR